MGGFGTPIGETKNYRLYLHTSLNCDYPKNNIELLKKTGKELHQTDCVFVTEYLDEKEHKHLEAFRKEMDEEHTLYHLGKKDKALRDKALFEKRYRMLEEKNIQLEKQNAIMRERLKQIKEI